MFWLLFLLIFSFPFAYLVTRLVCVITDIQMKRGTPRLNLKRKKQRIKTLVVIGSGGHTTEMLRLLSALSDVYSPRHYVVAKTDQISQDKILTFENEQQKSPNSKYEISQIPRSREVKQSWLSTMFSTLYASLCALPLVFRSRPDLVLCNGPGTCIPLCLSAFFLRVLGVKKIMIVYVESLCRVETLSLSARILNPIADQMIVQWPELEDKYPQTKYLGRLV